MPVNELNLPSRDRQPIRVAAVIVNYRTPQLTLNCLDALSRERAAIPDLKAIVVDNASGDSSAAVLSEALSKEPYSGWVRFLALSLNGGFGWGNNQAILTLMQDPLPPDAIYLVNPDAVIEPGALVALCEDMRRRDDAGAIGSQLLSEDGTPCGSAFRFPSIAREFVRGIGIAAAGRLLGVAPVLVPFGVRGPVDWVTGASVLLRSEALRDAGLFDTGFFLYFEEVELMHRLRQHGWPTYHCPESRVLHIEGAATGVKKSKSQQSASPPDYLFHSRHRYFALTGGRFAALAADIAWLFGTGLAALITALPLRRKVPSASSERRALMRIGLGGSHHDGNPSVTYLDDRTGVPPAWMR